VKSGTKVRPLVFGGGQERGLRAGTENVAGIAGFARAAELALEGQAEHCRRMSEARAAVLAVLREGIAGLTVNGHPTVRLPNVLHVGIPGVRSQNLVHFLEEAGVLVSAGAACHSTREKQSHVAAAMGLPADAAVLRVSVSRYTTAEEACEGARRIVAVVERLRR
jgi:cysteine desulfurase